MGQAGRAGSSEFGSRWALRQAVAAAAALRVQPLRARDEVQPERRRRLRRSLRSVERRRGYPYDKETIPAHRLLSARLYATH